MVQHQSHRQSKREGWHGWNVPVDGAKVSVVPDVKGVVEDIRFLQLFKMLVRLLVLVLNAMLLGMKLVKRAYQRPRATPI